MSIEEVKVQIKKERMTHFPEWKDGLMSKLNRRIGSTDLSVFDVSEETLFDLMDRGMSTKQACDFIAGIVQQGQSLED